MRRCEDKPHGASGEVCRRWVEALLEKPQSLCRGRGACYIALTMKISTKEFWKMKRKTQARSHALVESGKVAQRSVYFLRSEALENAKIKFPDRSSSARGLCRQE